MKKCGKCGLLKESAEFSKKKSSKDGLNHCCKPCDRERNKEWSLKNSEKKKATRKKYKWKGKTPYCRDKMLRSTYGITSEDYVRQLELQNGCCAICGKHHTKENKALAVDHCHTTGKVRGLLCWRCNSSIGRFEDNVSILSAAIEYLNNPPYEDKDE